MAQNNALLQELDKYEQEEDLVSVLIRIANSLEAIALVVLAQEKRYQELNQELDIDISAPDEDPYRLG